MASPFDNTPAVKSPSRYAALNMHGEQLTGLWTQANPYRDPAVSYLTSKFYGGSRIDRIIDGINREITQNLTDKRRPGSDVYNDLSFPAANSFYSWKYIQNKTEVVHVLQDGADGVIYDVTVGSKITLLTKSAGAGPARFLGVNTELFIGDGVDTQKVMRGDSWRANVPTTPGTLITTGFGPDVQLALGGLTLPIVATASTGTQILIYVDPSSIPRQFPNIENVEVTFSGLTVATVLNGTTLQVASVDSTTLGLFRVNAVQTAYTETTDTGSGNTGNGTTGGSSPGFSTTKFAITADGGQQWKCYGPSVQNWGLAAPPSAPTLVPLNGARWWQPTTLISTSYYCVIDSSGNIQCALGVVDLTLPMVTGRSYPVWKVTSVYNGINQTIDGNVVWWNFGPAGMWSPGTVYVNAPFSPGGQTAVILDSNQNLQWVYNGSGSASGSSEPVWATSIAGMTTDGGLTWVCMGPGVEIATASVQYAYSYHGVDGSVATASTPAYIQGGILGSPAAVGPYLAVQGVPTTDTQCDQIWIFRTPIGKTTLILEDQIPADYLTGTFTYDELGIPDVPVGSGGALNAFIAAPIAESNNPPQSTMGAPVYHLQRIWGIVDNMVVYSGGPDTLVGNGNTAFPPLNEIPYPAQPIYLLPVTVQGGGILVFTTSGVYIILGTGTPSDPFYTTIYYASVNLAGYNAIDVYNTAVFLMESNGKVSMLAIEYPFNPQGGYTEIGFPIGDQFKKVTTGGISAALYNPATAYVSWNIQSSAETSMFVSDGAVGWFNMQNINPPESGILWNPRAQIAGGTSAVQSIETSPGLHQLLIGPPVGTTGPILMRDATGTVFTDNGVPYPAWDIKGVMMLCSTGQWCEVSHVSTKSMAVGARPVVSTLMGEIRPTANHPWNALKLNNKSNDPPETPKSESVFSDRYLLAENGVPCTGDCISVRFDYGSQDEPDELLDFGIFAALMNEREEQVPAGQ